MKKGYLLLIIFIVICAFTLIFAYPKNQIQSSTLNPTPTPTSTKLDVIQLSNGWTKIIVHELDQTTYEKFSISYPPTWKLVNGATNEGFSLVKGLSTIGLARPAMGGAVCLFADTKLSDVPEPWRDTPVQKQFQQIVVKHGFLRRYKLPSQMDGHNNINYQVCELYKNDKVFELPLDGGTIGITTNASATKSDLKEIDSILSTYQYEE